ncbi:MAG: triose-phosphate isomerase [Desulfamplus sp.]|nr:triose-phosphate isomerase [Desulfamplus sp.]
MSRTPLIAGNWKMFKTGSEAVATARRLAEFASDITNIDIMIAPPFPSLALVSENLKSMSSRVNVGAQNLFYINEGAYTGEVSAKMLKAAGVSHVIIGHSERRQYFGETNEDICRKIKAAVESDLIPIMCIGETESEKKDGKTFYVLDKQIQNGLQGFRSNELLTLVIAYEPVWAIGTGNTATPEQAEAVHSYIRSEIEKMFNSNLAEDIRIIYGGSVKPDNISELMSHKNVDGALVGGASLDADKFIKIIKYNRIK